MGLWDEEFKKEYKWFKDVDSLEEGQKLYKALLFKHHPDHGGSNDTVVEIMKEWEKFVKAAASRVFLAQRKEGEDEAVSEAETEQSRQFSEKFFQVLDEVMKMNTHIEIIGTWIWVFGASGYDPVKLEALDFHFSKRHGGYWWNGMDRSQVSAVLDKYRNRPIPKLDLDDLRKMWGSEIKREKLHLE